MSGSRRNFFTCGDATENVAKVIVASIAIGLAMGVGNNKYRPSSNFQTNHQKLCTGNLIAAKTTGLDVLQGWEGAVADLAVRSAASSVVLALGIAAGYYMEKVVYEAW